MKMLLILAKASLFHMKTRVSLKFFVTDCGQVRCQQRGKIKRKTKIVQEDRQRKK